MKGGSAVVTLCEGDYWIAAAALANSLYFHGYRGHLWIGYRGELPDWARVDETSPDGFYVEQRVAEGFSIRFVRLTTNYHLTHYKAAFLLRIEPYEKESDRIFLIDVDITLNRPWSWFEQWIDRGIGICGDINYDLPHDDPKREGWRAFFAARGYRFEEGQQLDHFYNGGFLGLTRARFDFVRLWSDLIEGVAEVVGGLHRWSSEKPGPFLAADQEGLNTALMLTPEPLAPVGPDAMGFRPGEVILPHAIGPRKPWRRPFLWPSLLGRIVGVSDEEHWKFASGPVLPICSPLWAALRRIDLRIGKFVYQLRRRVRGRP